MFAAPCGAVSMMIRACTCMRPGARPPTPSGRRRSAAALARGAGAAAAADAPAQARNFWGGAARRGPPVETRSTRCGATPNGAKPRWSNGVALGRARGAPAEGVDRVACAAELVRQREVACATRAALAAESGSGRASGATRRRKLAEGGVAVAAPPPDALVGLRPEAEALMRGIFRDLDADATGSVPAAALRKALRGDDRLDRLMRNYCGPDAWADCLDALDRRLTALHAKPWGVSDCANEADRPFASTEDVTWGEVLLFFVPGPPPDASGVHLAARGSLRSSSSIDFRPRLLLGRTRVTFIGTGSGRADAAAAPSGSQPVDGRPGRAAARPRARGPRRGAHRDDAALLWRRLRLRSLRADAAQRDAASMKAERDAARAETKAARDRAAAAVDDARTNAAQAEARCAAQVKELQADLRDLREAMTRDVGAARGAHADDARAPRPRSSRIGRSRRCAGASATRRPRSARSRRRARRGRGAEARRAAPPARGSQIGRERAALLAPRSRDRPRRPAAAAGGAAAGRAAGAGARAALGRVDGGGRVVVRRGRRQAASARRWERGNRDPSSVRASRGSGNRPPIVCCACVRAPDGVVRLLRGNAKTRIYTEIQASYSVEV